MSTTTWNSDLLSKGSILSTTSFTPASDTEPRIRARMAYSSRRRLRAEAMKGPRMRRDSRSSLPESAAA